MLVLLLLVISFNGEIVFLFVRLLFQLNPSQGTLFSNLELLKSLWLVMSSEALRQMIELDSGWCFSDIFVSFFYLRQSRRYLHGAIVY